MTLHSPTTGRPQALHSQRTDPEPVPSRADYAGSAPASGPGVPIGVPPLPLREW